MAPSKTASAAAVLGPEVAAPLAAEEAAKRFWGGLVQALGKDCYETVTVKVGRKTVLKSRRIFGQERTVDLSGPAKVVTTRHAVARWEVLPLLILGAAAAGYAAAQTERGAAAISKAKTYSPRTKLQGYYTSHKPAWIGTQNNAIGIPYHNYMPGGGANPFNYL